MSKTVLITGASSGIGRATARLFLDRGWNVVATARDPAKLQDLPHTPECLTLPLDVTQESTIVAALQATTSRFGAIDVLVNNAGYGLFGPLEGVTPEQLEAQFRTNVFGVVNTIRHVLPIMRQRRSGTIVNVSSMAGRIVSPFMAPYHATKFAIEGLSESLAYELSLFGIRIKLVEPGHFKTGFFERGLVRSAHPAYDKAFDNFMLWVMLEDAKAPGVAPVADAIFQAATDSSSRLRYPVDGRLMLAVKAIMPGTLWRWLMGQGMTRLPKARVQT